MRHLKLFVSAAAMALVANLAHAETVAIKVPGTAMLWDLKKNKALPFGRNDGTRPVVADLTLKPGMLLRIDASGATTTAAGGASFGPDGQADYICNDSVGGSGTLFPSKFINSAFYPVRLNELLAVFTDSQGHIVKSPFPVGSHFVIRVPDGAERIQFGVNDDIYADNSGALDVRIETGEAAPVAASPSPPPAPPVLPPYPAEPVQPIAVHADHNPILSDGQYYTTDPAPLVVGDTLYILTGRDEAPEGVNDFIMNEWQALTTKDVASGDWSFYPHFLRPEKVFAWATPGRAYAGQIIQGPDKRFYLYAPVMRADCGEKDCFGIGVAVSDSSLGPWIDAHPQGPIVSQSGPERNDIQNIDPTPFVDDDGRVYLYWGTFGQLRGMELNADMVTPKGPEISVKSLTGFFEAPWLFKRNGVYYLAYADNDTDPRDGCTPAVYHACIAYGTAPSPLGPWTYRGVVLPPVSSTTSHPGIVAFKGRWWIVYHTADAKGGGHFRRSVAIDELKWDDSVNPARMIEVRPTPAPPSILPPQRNIAPAAHASASNEPVPVQYWIKALNDGVVRQSPLPPDMWGTWNGHNPPQPWIQYGWDKPVTLNGSRIWFFNDQPAGAGDGVAVPRAWRLDYLKDGVWTPIPAAYPTLEDAWNTVSFAPITTTCLRAVFEASSKDGSYAGVGVQEWEALAPEVQSVRLAAPGATGGCPAA
ncbi:MAG TPA: family 43 glycosylhydrolase [Asticcacaulis sp.]|nr:family 43 glycosylhydrolase [Asticcacaulis sp.]